MNSRGIFVLLAVITTIITGCASTPVNGGRATGFSSAESAHVRSDRTGGAVLGESAPSKQAGDEANGISGRMLIWTGSLTIEVEDVKAGMDKAAQIAKQYGGYVENSSGDGESRGYITLKIPSSSFHSALKSAQGLGNCTQTMISSRDVTDQFVDVQARLKSKIELRDRLRKLLDRATDIKDVLAIESELTRLQGEIESMQGTLKLLQGQVDYATVNVTFQRKKILGPIGIVFKGIWWGFKKLFVLRD